MRKKNVYLFVGLLFVLSFTSCSNDQVICDLEENQERLCTNVSDDSIQVLEESDFPKIEDLETRSGTPPEVDEELYQLNGLDFYIQSREYNYGKNTLEAVGRGKEVKLDALDMGNSNQKFRIKFLPPSTGIMYMIYSSKYNVPIGAGSYSSSPNEYVLFAKRDDSGGSFGFSWNFYSSSSKDAYIIENDDLIAGGPSIWDYYRYAIRANNDGTLNLTKNQSSTAQEFVFIPDDEFEIKGLKLDYNLGSVKSQKPEILDHNYIVNDDMRESISHQFSYSESLVDNVSFQEQNNISITRKIGLDLNFSVPEVVNIGLNSSIQSSTSQIITYGESTSMTTNITKSYSITISPMTRCEYTFMATKYTLDVPYVVVVQGRKSGKEIQLHGVWSGVDYSETRMEVKKYDITTSELHDVEIVDL